MRTPHFERRSASSRAASEAITVGVCSNWHPFYTGKQTFVGPAGMVEKFQRKWKGEAAQKAQAIANHTHWKLAKLAPARTGSAREAEPHQK